MMFLLDLTAFGVDEVDLFAHEGEVAMSWKTPGWSSSSSIVLRNASFLRGIYGEGDLSDRAGERGLDESFSARRNGNGHTLRRDAGIVKRLSKTALRCGYRMLRVSHAPLKCTRMPTPLSREAAACVYRLPFHNVIALVPRKWGYNDSPHSLRLTFCCGRCASFSDPTSSVLYGSSRFWARPGMVARRRRAPSHPWLGLG